MKTLYYKILLVMFTVTLFGCHHSIIDKFEEIDQSLQNTSEVFTELNDSIYKTLEDTALISFIENSNLLIDFIDSLQVILVAETDDISYDSASMLVNDISLIHRKDNYEIPQSIMIDKGYGKKLRIKITEYNQLVCKLSDTSIVSPINITLTKTNNPYNYQSWEESFFYHTVLAADLVLLDKLISEVYNTNIQVINNFIK